MSQFLTLICFDNLHYSPYFLEEAGFIVYWEWLKSEIE